MTRNRPLSRWPLAALLLLAPLAGCGSPPDAVPPESGTAGREHVSFEVRGMT